MEQRNVGMVGKRKAPEFQYDQVTTILLIRVRKLQKAPLVFPQVLKNSVVAELHELECCRDSMTSQRGKVSPREPFSPTMGSKTHGTFSGPKNHGEAWEPSSFPKVSRRKFRACSRSPISPRICLS